MHLNMLTAWNALMREEFISWLRLEMSPKGHEIDTECFAQRLAVNRVNFGEASVE